MTSPRLATPLNRWAIVVSGSRHWIDREAVHGRLRSYPTGTIVLHGGAPGVDTIADQRCGTTGHAVPHPFFDEHGRAGGPIRNSMLIALLDVYRKFGYQTAVEAFLINGIGNVGTMNLIGHAKRMGFEPIVTCREPS